MIKIKGEIYYDARKYAGYDEKSSEDAKTDAKGSRRA
jgi:hypothetical protein